MHEIFGKNVEFLAPLFNSRILTINFMKISLTIKFTGNFIRLVVFLTLGTR